MFGPDILVRSLSQPGVTDRFGNIWQYHSRSDRHSKIACWAIVFDLLDQCSLLRRHVASGQVTFGINHEMRDFRQDRKKNLDVVICTPARAEAPHSPNFESLIPGYGIELNENEIDQLKGFPAFRRSAVGSVLMALEAKACMTAHQRALPRLYDELNSSHLTVHGANDHAISAGFVMVNAAERYLSPDLNKKNRFGDPEWSVHKQPRDTEITVDKVKQLPRRVRAGEEGYDALAIVVVKCVNDGTPVRLVGEPPAPRAGDIYDYAAMISRLSNAYATRFKDL